MYSEINPASDKIAEHLINRIISEMTSNLMEDYGCSLRQALDIVYTSRTLDLLQQIQDELYIQSPSYVYEILLQEKPIIPPAATQ